MERVDVARDRILGAARQVWSTGGLAKVTVARVAKAAGVSSALVHYHFATKSDLLEAVAQETARALSDDVAASLAEERHGLAAIDELWRRLSRAVDQGLERVRLELALGKAGLRGVAGPVVAARRERSAALERRLPSLFRELGIEAPMSAEEAAAALDALLDGAALALVSGAPRARVRSAWDAFWLALLAAGQRER
jgi:AcrR family transcriptional regulator